VSIKPAVTADTVNVFVLSGLVKPLNHVMTFITGFRVDFFDFLSSLSGLS
jgi:hypothetical protein